MSSKTIKLPNTKTQTFSVKIGEKECKCVIQEPTFENISVAMTELMGMTGKLNLIGAGKVIFESCCVEYDQEIEDNVKILVKLCLQLAAEYVSPADEEIKKN